MFFSSNFFSDITQHWKILEVIIVEAITISYTTPQLPEQVLTLTYFEFESEFGFENQVPKYTN